jgi:hypothetical protein
MRGAGPDTGAFDSKGLFAPQAAVTRSFEAQKAAFHPVGMIDQRSSTLDMAAEPGAATACLPMLRARLSSRQSLSP